MRPAHWGGGASDTEVTREIVIPSPRSLSEIQQLLELVETQLRTMGAAHQADLIAECEWQLLRIRANGGV